ncbi:MAG TPA: hypothetical protein VFT74_10995, partial [Isosphaeraceae bacterium]|nr:hypothetical protein [Isosphaeraceae bacterium]
MPSHLIETITSSDLALRDRSIDDLLNGLSASEILRACEELERFRKSASNLYDRVRASMFL